MAARERTLIEEFTLTIRRGQVWENEYGERFTIKGVRLPDQTVEFDRDEAPTGAALSLFLGSHPFYRLAAPALSDTDGDAG